MTNHHSVSWFTDADFLSEFTISNLFAPTSGVGLSGPSGVSVCTCGLKGTGITAAASEALIFGTLHQALVDARGAPRVRVDLGE